MQGLPGNEMANDQKPLLVRVKRKSSQSPLDALWLEINERPFKKPLLDFGNLSLSESSSSIVKELETRKVLLRHVETVTSSEVTLDVLQSVVPAPADESKLGKGKEIRRTFKTEDKHDQLLAKAKQSQESVSKNARFKQIWRSRKSKKDSMHDEPLHDVCQFYDVVRVDFEETNQEVLNDHKRNRDAELEDHKLMSQYLPLLKEILPSAAAEIESDIHDYVSRQAASDDFVYDIYTVKDEMNISEEDVAQSIAVVQVDAEDDFYDGPDGSDYESDDSNAENNPLNDYPDEESSEENSEDNTSSEDKSETGSTSSEDHRQHAWSDDDNLYSDDARCDYEGGDSDDDERM